jgi:hypothetical protein
MSNRTRYIRDHEDRLDTDDALHSEIIGGRLPASVSTYTSGDIPARWPSRGGLVLALLATWTERSLRARSCRGCSNPTRLPRTSR